MYRFLAVSILFAKYAGSRGRPLLQRWTKFGSVRVCSRMTRLRSGFVNRLSDSGLVVLALAAIRRYLMMFGMSLLPFSSLRVFVMRLSGVKIGRGCYVGFNVVFDTNHPSSIRIGDCVRISHDVVIYTHTETPVANRLARIYHSVKPVVVNDGAWISANVLLMPGVEIGRDCMIGAGSVVTRNTDPGFLYAGNPARKVKAIAFGDESP